MILVLSEHTGAIVKGGVREVACLRQIAPTMAHYAPEKWRKIADSESGPSAAW